MKKPNFFIVGAPKCGTTSLYFWLSEHPRIFMSSWKEINYFNMDHRWPGRLDLSAYESLFRRATDRYGVVGEASVWYLYSNVAIPNILEYSETARFVVCLRNPVEMAHALYEQQVFNLKEPLTSFEEAWKLQEARLRGCVEVPKDVEPSHLAYGNVCKLGEQLERAYSQANPKCFLPVFLDDMRRDPLKTYNDVLSFLGLPVDGRSTFPVLNRAKEVRFPTLKRLVLTLGQWKRQLGVRAGLGVLNKINRRNVRTRPRRPLSESMQRELKLYFRQDVAKLGQLTGRDLDHWIA